MSWFKENKFLGGLIVITVILAGVIISFGMKLQGTLDEKISEVEAKEASLKDMKGLDPYPTPESAKAKTESLKALLADAGKMQAQFLSFKPESTAPIPVNQFSALLKDADEKIRGIFDGKIVIPDSFYLGFETYKTKLPTPESTGELAYQLSAIEWLMEELAAAGATEVNNIVREEIPSEKGESATPAPSTKKKGSSKGKAAPAKRGSALPKIAERMPVELVFRGPESALRQVLSSMADSDKFFFDIRLARIKNESPIPTKPNRGRGPETAEVQPADTGAFGDVEGDGDEPEAAADAPAAPSQKILDRVAGGDDVTAYIRADLLLFTEGQQFPEIK